MDSKRTDDFKECPHCGYKTYRYGGCMSCGYGITPKPILEKDAAKKEKEKKGSNHDPRS